MVLRPSPIGVSAGTVSTASISPSGPAVTVLRSKLWSTSSSSAVTVAVLLGVNDEAWSDSASPGDT